MESRSSREKRLRIAQVSLSEFLGKGYTAASVDAIAAGARVSKPTVYRYFGSKERLFLDVVGEALEGACGELKGLDQEMADAPDVSEALTSHVLSWARILISPRTMALHRLVVGEAERFPQLAELWYRVGYMGGHGPLVRAFAVLDERGVLRCPDPDLAAHQLVAATCGVPQAVRALRAAHPYEEEALTRICASGVHAILGMYEPRSA